jgi:hypothetical protein
VEPDRHHFAGSESCQIGIILPDPDLAGSASFCRIRILPDRHHFAGSGSELASGACRIFTTVSIAINVNTSF